MFSFVLVVSFSAVVVTTSGQIQSSATTCTAPRKSPDKTFTIYGNNDQPIKGERVPKGGYIQSQCADGYLFSDGKNTSLSICRPIPNVEWYPAIKSCRRICSPLKPSNLVLTCRYKGHEINCDDSPMFSGVEITPRCKELHHVSQNFIPEYTTIRCRDDGTWNNKLFRCDPECGLPLQDPLIENGSNATLGQFPWNVAIYSIPRGYRLICGGTLIAPTVVLSAAHCFYNESFGYPLTTPTDYAIVVGKLTRSYARIDGDAQKTLPISEILFHDDKPFNPSRRGYSADIALIILKECATISAHVLPACFRTHLSNGFKPDAGVMGVLCGWGLDESKEPSELLKTTQLPFVQYNQCSEKLPGLSLDKFCAGSDEGPRARPGDSGGGLVFKDMRTHLYYVRGLVSTSERFSTSALTSFTDLSYYQDWIDRTIQEKSDLGSNEMHVQLETSTGLQRTSTVTSIRPPQTPITRRTTTAPMKPTSLHQAGPIALPSTDTTCNSIRAKYEHFSWSCGPRSCSEGENSLHNRYLFEKVRCDDEDPSRICCPKFGFKLTPSLASTNSNTMSAASHHQAGPITVPSMDTTCNSIRAKYEHFSWSCGPRSCSEGEKSLHNRYLFEKVRCDDEDPSRICCPKFDFKLTPSLASTNSTIPGDSSTQFTFFMKLPPSSFIKPQTASVPSSPAAADDDKLLNELKKKRYSVFDRDLLSVLAKENPRANIVVSPFSIKLLLALILEGAGGQTSIEILRALQLPLNKVAAIALLEKLQSLVLVPEKSSLIILESQSKIYKAPDIELQEEYKNTVLNRYKAYVEELDFSQPQIASNHINGWVNNSTLGLIPSLVEEDNIEDTMKLFLVNYIYLKGNWDIEFNRQATRSGCFHPSYNNPDECRTVAYMYKKRAAKYQNSEDLDARIVEIPFKDTRYVANFLLPNEKNNAHELLEKMNRKDLMGLFSTLEQTSITLQLPRTTINYSSNLTEVLQHPSLRIRELFKPTADLSKMLDTQAQTGINSILHQARIEMNEEGTRAAEASGGNVQAQNSTSEKNVVFDRPYLFFIRDTKVGGFLFEGIVVSPDGSGD